MKQGIIYSMVLFLAISHSACGQPVESHALMEYSEKTRDSLVNQLKRYSFEPNYQIAINTQNCYDVLVNDYLVTHDYGRYKQRRSFFIGWGILKSGRQRLQIKLYPEFIKGEVSESLKNEDYLELTVSYFTWSRDNTGIDERVEVLRYELPQKDLYGNDIDYSEKKELVIDLEFEAKVPYELKGWTDGIVFDRKDSLLLKEKLAAIYNEDIDDFKHRRFDRMKARSFYHDLEIAQSLYENKEEFQKEYENVEDEGYEFLPLENYDIFFYGDGRLITLRRTDNRFLGDSPYIRTYINERGARRFQFLKLFFYKPKGTDKLVLIR